MPSAVPLSDTQLIQTYGLSERIKVTPAAVEARSPVHILGEIESVAPFFPVDVHENPESLLCPKSLYEGKRVAVIPGYGSLPFILHALGAKDVVGIDLDPLTVAWQRKKLELGGFKAADVRLVFSSFSVRQNNFHIDRLTSEVDNLLTTPKETRTLLPGVSFHEADIRDGLQGIDGQFDLIVIPYLFGLAHGVNAADVAPTLEKLSQKLTPNGAMLILPATAVIEMMDISSNLRVFEKLQEFSQTHQFELTLSPSYRFLHIFGGSAPVEGTYCILSKR